MGRALNQQNHSSPCDALLQRYCSSVYSVWSAEDAGRPTVMATGTATATLMDRTGAFGMADMHSRSIILGRTTSLDTNRISTVLQEEAISVVSMAVDFMVVVAAGTGAE